MRKLIVIAEDTERPLIEKYLPREITEGREVLVSGVGILNVMHALRDLPLDTDIINIGYAGSANFEVGRVAIVTESRLNHPNVTFKEPTFKLMSERVQVISEKDPIYAPCYTNCDFVLESTYTDCLFDMELAAIMGLGFTKVSAVKLVSDNLSFHDYRKESADKVITLND